MCHLPSEKLERGVSRTESLATRPSAEAEQVSKDQGRAVLLQCCVTGTECIMLLDRVHDCWYNFHATTPHA